MVRTLMFPFTAVSSVVPEAEQRGIAANRLLWLLPERTIEDTEAAQLSEKFWQPGSVRCAGPRDVLRAPGNPGPLGIVYSLLPQLKEMNIHLYSTAQMGSLGPFLTMQWGTEGVRP